MPFCFAMFKISAVSKRCSMFIAKPKAILTYDKVIDIFKLRPDSKLARGEGFRPSAAVAFDFGISEKTVRDIWRARTWHRETLHLDPCRPARAMALPGRPLGRKDSAPRKRQQRTLPSICKPVLIPAGTKSDVTYTKRRNISSSSPCLSMADIVSNPIFNDPFHDDWPHWSRAESFQGEGINAGASAVGAASLRWDTVAFADRHRQH